jgi:Icc-related predicted phosphoesterase
MAKLRRSFLLGLILFGSLAVVRSSAGHADLPDSSNQPVALELKVPPTFRFVALGDTRFHDPSDSEPANPAVRQALVAAIDKEHPAFISIGGDIVYTGENTKDWQVWDSETAIWREHEIPVYPAIGNHDLKGDRQTALKNYFARFPEIQQSRYYSVRMGNALMLVLDSNLYELSGPQGDWLRSQLDHLSSTVDFVLLVFHHPPYTSSSDENKALGGGHSARAAEQALAKYLEDRQQHTRARFVVFNGHVHNYEHHEHGGVTYIVTGGGGARPYLIAHPADDLYRDPGVNYHYLLLQVDHNRLTITMNKLELKDGKQIWSKPDTVTINAPGAVPAAAD